jgi:CheY-like chemotaxis protein
MRVLVAEDDPVLCNTLARGLRENGYTVDAVPAVPLDGHKPLGVTGSVGVRPTGRAAARRGARHREDVGVPAVV